MHLLLGFWWPLMVSYPPAGMSAAVCWAEDAQGPPGVGLVPPVPMRGLALALAAQRSGGCKGMRACRNERGGTRVENLPVKGLLSYDFITLLAHTRHVINRKNRAVGGISRLDSPTVNYYAQPSRLL